MHRGVSLNGRGRASTVYNPIAEAVRGRLMGSPGKGGAGEPTPYRELKLPLLRYINRLDRKRDDDIVTMHIPEFVPAKWWQHLSHNQRSLLLKGALLFRRGVIVTSLPYHLEK